MDKTIKISNETYEQVKQVAKKEMRSIKTIVNLAVAQYKGNKK